MYDNRVIYFYKNVVFFVRATKDFAYLYNNLNEFIGGTVNNFVNVQALADWYLDLENGIQRTKPEAIY
jgi:hypothetical protein